MSLRNFEVANLNPLVGRGQCVITVSCGPVQFGLLLKVVLSLQDGRNYGSSWQYERV